MTAKKTAEPARNRGYLRTHEEIVAGAVRLLAEKGPAALSVAELARQLGVDRTTIYHHFKDRRALIEAVMAWSSEQLTTAFGPATPSPQDSGFIAHHVFDNPALIRLWIDQLIAASDIRESYPNWDQMVATTGEHMAASHAGEQVDSEIFSMILLMATIIGPLAYHRSVEPDSPMDDIVLRFRRELARILRLPPG